MTDQSLFGVRLWRLLAARRPTYATRIEDMTADLANRSSIDPSSLDAVLKEGVAPSPEMLRKLGPELRIHRADLFVIAGLPVPAEFASAWRTSPWDVHTIVCDAVRLAPDRLVRLDEMVRSMSVQPRSAHSPVDRYPEGPGALLLRLLTNRNMRPFNAQSLCEVGGGPYVSYATVAGLGPGLVAITPQYVTAFAHLLGYTPEDMVALTGVGPVMTGQYVHPSSAEIAKLAWNARHLTSDQIAEVVKAAKEME